MTQIPLRYLNGTMRTLEIELTDTVAALKLRLNAAAITLEGRKLEDHETVESAEFLTRDWACVVPMPAGALRLIFQSTTTLTTLDVKFTDTIATLKLRMNNAPGLVFKGRWLEDHETVRSAGLLWAEGVVLLSAVLCAWLCA